ncbi:hypothetical protein DYB25_013825, partial [Aphanomyces astaci]
MTVSHPTKHECHNKTHGGADNTMDANHYGAYQLYVVSGLTLLRCAKPCFPMRNVDGCIPPLHRQTLGVDAQRKQWTRDFDAVGEAYWNNAPGIPPISSAIIYLVHSTRSSYASTAALALSPLTAASASKTLLGDPIASWWLPNLKTLRSYTFSIKYAWLLEQLSLVYTGHTKIEVRRAALMPMSLKLLGEIKPDNLCTKTKITLLGESAIDAGGVSREWYTLVTKAIFEADEGLFMVANKDDQSFFINPKSERDHGPNHLADFQAIGRLLGRAIIDGQVLPFHFCVPLFKMLLGYPVSI